MFDFAEMSRVANAIESLGTLNSKTLSIAFMEFLESGDSNLMKSLWLSHGFEDISPLWGHESRVPTFKDKPDMIARWPEFQQAMTECEADWYYLSGHHSRQFTADDEPFDMMIDMFNDLDRVGFFNEPYHETRWVEADIKYDPEAGRSEKNIFMWTSRDEWDDPYQPGPEDNPLYAAPHEDCRGVMLIGCQSLTYRASRAMYNKYFPNALIIGLVSTENAAITKVTKLCQSLGRDFFVDPKQFDPADLVARLNPTLGPFDNIAIQTDGELWFKGTNGVVSQDAEDPIEIADL